MSKKRYRETTIDDDRYPRQKLFLQYYSLLDINSKHLIIQENCQQRDDICIMIKLFPKQLRMEMAWVVLQLANSRR